MFFSWDLALKCLPSNQSNPRTVGLGLFFLGWVGEEDVCIVVVAAECLFNLSRA